jgi:hypothetical protein
MVLIFQALGFAGLHKYVANTWLAIFILCGLLGLIILIKDGWRSGSGNDSDVDTSGWGQILMLPIMSTRTAALEKGMIGNF